MKQIMKRYIGIIVCIVALLLFINGILFYGWQKGKGEEHPKEFSRLISELSAGTEGYVLSEDSESFIRDNYEWAMLIGNDGEIIYDYALPDSLKRTYTIGEVADFSKWYLEDYPITTVNSPEGVIVLGEKKGSLWKQNISIYYKNIGVLILAGFVINIIAAVLLAALFSALFSKDLKSVICGIVDLADNKAVHLPENGYLVEVCRSVNHVSDKLTEQWTTIQKGNEMRAKWLSGVSHDIRTPLEIMVGNLEEVSQEVSEEGIRNQLYRVRNQCFKIKSLLADLNLVNSLEAKIRQDEKKSVNLCRVIRECMAELINTYDTSCYTLDFIYDETDAGLFIYADENLLKRAFHNLLMNSVLHNEEGCHIEVVFQRENTMAMVCFRDDGIGITDEKRKELSDVVNYKEEKAHGWGILVVKQIVEYHKGRVVFPNTDHGMEVKIIIPI